MKGILVAVSIALAGFPGAGRSAGAVLPPLAWVDHFQGRGEAPASPVRANLQVRATPVEATSQAVDLGRVLVVPFENANREGRLYWLTEASAILVTERLAASGLNVISRDERLRAFERLQLPPVASLSDATIIRVGQLVGATRVVLGTFGLEGGNLAARAKSIELDTGRTTAELVERGPLDGLFAIYDALGRKLADRPGDAVARTPPREPLAAFENYVKGLLAESPGGQVRFLEAALKAAPRYDAARIALWQVYANQGDHARAVAAALAVPADSPLSRRARFLAALSHIRAKQYDEAFQGLKALLDETPAPAVFNNLGVVQLRRAAAPQASRATYYFNLAAQTEHDDPDYAFNLGYAYWIERDPQATVYWLKEAVRRNPADGDAHYVLGVALHANGALVEADREKELARQLSSKYTEWERRSAAAGDPLPKGLERLREELDTPHLSLVDATLGPSEKRDQQDLAAFHLQAGRRLYEQQRDREAAVELNHSLYISPYQAEAHLLLGRIHLRAGRLREATVALTISLWSQETVAAHVALGEVYLQAKETSLAAAQADRALALDPQSAEAQALKARIK